MSEIFDHLHYLLTDPRIPGSLAGADLDVRNYSGESPLSRAVSYDDVAIVKALHEAGTYQTCQQETLISLVYKQSLGEMIIHYYT